jgi:site-specific DNA-methyltransferase (adenine-specific)
MINLIHGDCLEKLKDIPNKSIDFILTDPPYGTTACKWDVIIPFDLMWKELNRVIKDNGAIALFGAEPFSSQLRLSNVNQYKHDWIWKKDSPTGFLNANKYPLRIIELISIFSKKTPTYYPVKTIGIPYKAKKGSLNKIYGKDSSEVITINNGERFPLDIIEVSREKKKLHPTQKPVPLLEYLIKTYTLENETVLDFTMGSGSTGVACKNLNRNFIGIEKDDKYFEIAKNRIESHIVDTTKKIVIP